MNAFRSLVSAATLALALQAALPAAAQTVGYNVRTGDVWVDARLGEINDYGRRYHDPFVSEITGHYGAPRSLVLDLLDRRGWAPADVYYACAIARALGIPCLDVVQRYERNPSQGWGNLAKQMGIKPGSPAFHALKNGTASTYDRWGYPVRVDQRVSVDWSRHGPGHGKSGAPASAGKGQGKPAAAASPAKGNPGKGNAGAQDKGSNGKGNGKGNGNGQGNGRDK